MRTGRWMSSPLLLFQVRVPGALLPEGSGGRGIMDESVCKAEGEPRVSHDMSPGLCNVSFSEDNHGTRTQGFSLCDGASTGTAVCPPSCVSRLGGRAPGPRLGFTVSLGYKLSALRRKRKAELCEWLRLQDTMSWGAVLYRVTVTAQRLRLL